MAATLRTAFACAGLLLLGAGHAVAADAVPGGGTALVVVGDSAAPSSGLRAALPVVLETIAVDPAQTRAGGIVDLRTLADCGGVATGQVGSAAFAAPVGLALADDGGLYAQARIAAGVAPGTYPVREVCSGHAVAAGQVTVVQPATPAPRPATAGGWREMPTASSGSSASADVAGSASASGVGAIRDGAVGILLASGAVYSVVVLRRRVTNADV
jgi:hypothetical protein